MGWFLLAVAFLAIPNLLFIPAVKRSGFSGWWVALSLVPGVGVVLLWVWAFAKWPLQPDTVWETTVIGSDSAALPTSPHGSKPASPAPADEVVGDRSGLARSTLGSLVPLRDPSSAVPEDQHWAQALAELDSAGRQPGLWARCFAEAQGNESLGRANYLNARARQLAEEQHSHALKAQRAELKAMNDAEAARLAEEQRRYDALPKGHCPNCNEVILLSAQECKRCRALFAPGCAWKVVPIK